MIIGITVSFVCFFNCINLYHLIVQKKTEQEQYKYTNEVGMSYVNYSGEGKLTDLITSEQGNIILKDATLYRDSVSADGITDVIVCQNEPLIYPVEAGSLPQSDVEITEPTVILGRSQREYAVYENGEYYYTLEGVKCRVCAFLGSASSDLYDYNVIVYYNSLDARAKDKIDSIAEGQFALQSNFYEMEEIIYTTEAKLSDSKDIIVGQRTADFMEAQSVSSEDSGYYLIIFLFCLINIVIVSEYWIKGRYKEIAVRKIFGYSDKKIYSYLYRDMLVNVSIAVLFAVVAQIILKTVFSNFLQIYVNQFLYYLGYTVGFILLFSGVLLIYPCKLLHKEDVLKRLISNCS